MYKFLKKIGEFILDLIFPIECLNCHQEGGYFCDNCFKKLNFNKDSDLKRLSFNLKTPSLDKIFIAGDYEDKNLKNLIIKYKYNFLSPLGKILGKFLIIFWKMQETEVETLNFKILKPNKKYLVIPIPLSKKRLKWRGFNQAEIIAREFSNYFNHELSLNLKRIKNQKPQAELSESERLNNLKSAFSWESENNGPALEDYTIILIDDVITTGATLNEAAETLKKSGASEVYALVIAKG
ncbi:MAG: ComF family protein [Patescibacteria group bacterium]